MALTSFPRTCARSLLSAQPIARWAGSQRSYDITDAKKEAIIHGFSNVVPGTTYSEIEVIDAFANYFKHRDEWPPKWGNATGQSAQTVRIIRSVGAAEDSSDNCRKGLMALGIDRVFEIHRMAGTLTHWHAKLADAYKNEVMPLGEP